MTGLIGLVSFFLFIWVFMWMSIFEYHQENPIIIWRIPIFCAFHEEEDISNNVLNHSDAVTAENAVLNHTDGVTLQNNIFRDTDLIKVRFLRLECFGEEFEIDLTLYNTLQQDARKEMIINKKGDFVLLDGNSFELYHGNVRDKENSFVLGFFLHTGIFRGYIIADQMYGFESTIDKGNKEIICYRLKDIMAKDCFNEEKKDCSQSEFFKKLEKGTITSQENSRNNEYKKLQSKNGDHEPEKEVPSSTKFSTIDKSNKNKMFEVKNKGIHPASIITSTRAHKNGGELGNKSSFPPEIDVLDSIKIARENASQVKPVSKSKRKKHIDINMIMVKNMTKHLFLEDTQTLLFDDVENLSFKSSTLESDALSCGLKIIASRSLMEFFEENSTDLVKDIYLQTEMLNILYRKLTFQNKTNNFIVKFHIETIILQGKDLSEHSSQELSLEELIKSYSHDKSFSQACLIVGLDMKLPNTEKLFDQSPETGEACIDGKNIIIVSHGTSENPKPMAFYFASYVTAITRALASTDSDKVCHLSSSENPLVMIEEYFLSNHIEPSSSYGIFSDCYIREIENSLLNKTMVHALEKKLVI
ncbi:uncharacterized protein [Parasteatoda tepidariorum]|uniref:uncharacterized protein isoform X2 n=1 Tax=Parasteatoda tepidariorum TaxID=114398 RepID=UPI0039BD18B0